MKYYPKMTAVTPGDPVIGRECVAFDKLDGSNLRFEYSRKRGWYKFGTRNRMFDKSDPDFGGAVDLFLDKYGSSLAAALQRRYPKVDSFVAFAEYHGPHSFAGVHDPARLVSLGRLEAPAENPTTLVLFDVNVYKQGFVAPEEFIDLFGPLGIPSVVYRGELSPEFVESVRRGGLPVTEGVIVKGGVGHDLWMRKIKTLNYLAALRAAFGGGWESHWE